MKLLSHLTLLLFALSPLTHAFAGSAVNDACKRLCETERECVRKCVGHSELMELRADLINVASDFHKEPELRLTALRTGASLETFEICRRSGWSTANQLTCLRAYPTPELMKSCKKLSPREEEQVKCIRIGKTSAEVDACLKILVSNELRLECVGLKLAAEEIESCELKGKGSHDRLRCLKGSARHPASQK
jgi:hypothetical protein